MQQMTKNWTARMVAILAVCALAMVPVLASAQAKKKRSSVRGKGNISVNKFDAAGQSDGTDLGAIEIEGRIFKPAVFFVLARGDIQYQGLQFKQSFVDRIVIGALKRPF